jgi:hypothetical protein
MGRMLTAELDTPYELAENAVERFRRDGFVHLHARLRTGRQPARIAGRVADAGGACRLRPS